MNNRRINIWLCKAFFVLILILNICGIRQGSAMHTPVHEHLKAHPNAVMCVGDVAAGEAVLTRLGKVGSGLKYAIKGLQLCDKVTDITRPLAQGLKVSTALIRKGGKLLPEIRIDGNTILHHIDDKLHIRKWDVGSNNVVDEPLAESELSQKVKEVLERGKDAASVGRYSLANISKERGFIDLLPDLLKKEGLTMDDFHYMMLKNVNALTEAEKAQLARIRNAMPKPDANTVMQKVIPKTDIENYINPTSNNYKQIGGYVSTAADTKHLKTFEDLYYGERLDYTNSKFFTSANSCGVIRFKNTRSSEVVIPTGPQYNGYDYPFTAHGFTSGSNGRLGVPEWHFQSRIDIQEGTEIWEIFNDGTEELRAIYRSGKFVIIR